MRGGIARRPQKNHPHRQADKHGDAEGDKGEKNLAHQTVTDAKGIWKISLPSSSVRDKIAIADQARLSGSNSMGKEAPTVFGFPVIGAVLAQ
jgi:hypothetical protein